MWADGGRVGGAFGSVAGSVLREGVTRRDSNILGTSGGTGDCCLYGDSLAFCES